MQLIRPKNKSRFTHNRFLPKIIAEIIMKYLPKILTKIFVAEVVILFDTEKSFE